MKRIILLSNQLKSTEKSNSKKNIISSSYDYLNFDEFLQPEEREYRLKLRNYLIDNNIEEQISKHFYEDKMPMNIIHDVAKEFPEIVGLTLKGYGSKGISYFLSCALIMELARIDMYLAGFFLIHGGSLCMNVIYSLGSEEQRLKYLPKMNTLEYRACFCLTEPDIGSDATNLKTTATPDGKGNFIINGKKRWIGGGGGDTELYIVWARNTDTKNIEGFIIEKGTNGLSSKLMTGKLAFKCAQNYDITFDNVVIPLNNRLEKADNFHNGLNNMLVKSRLAIAWACCGTTIGCYDRAIKYCSERKQFGKSLTSFQITQMKLTQMMGTIQAMLYFTKRIGDMYLQNKLTQGLSGLCKGWCSLQGREVTRLARELFGGNGLLIENWVMKALVDMEALYTFEGAYDINMLACGKELTGKSAFV